jgi:16S rRNA G966 N2-methylase RsmD
MSAAIPAGGVAHQTSSMPPSHSITALAPLLATIAGRLQPPLAIALGSPREAAELVAVANVPNPICWQLDLYQAARLREELNQRRLSGEVVVMPDLWDLTPPAQTILFPVSQGGERMLKLDVIEQAFHTLAPGGHFIVLSPYESDNVLQPALKKVFGRVHVPTGDNALFWCRREGERPRRRHEMTFQVRVDENKSLRFLSRPGVFSYGRFDHGARALVDTAEIRPGDRVVDLGCGCGTNGILASERAGPEGFIAFVESNVRALALAELNAQSAGVKRYQLFASAEVAGLPEATFDVVLANPPYYAQLSIARLFIERGKTLLKPGGRFYLVTKMLEQVAEIMGECFGESEIFERRGYFVFCATAPLAA